MTWGICGWGVAGVGGSFVRVVPFADGCDPAVCCPCGEAGTEMGGGFVLVSKAWAVARIVLTVVCLLRGAFAVCGGGWLLDVGGLGDTGRVLGLVVPAVPSGVTVACGRGGSVSLARCEELRCRGGGSGVPF